MKLSHYFRPVVKVNSYDDAQSKKMAELREFSKELSAQALALLPFQAVLAAALGATVSRDKANALAATTSVGLLALSFCCTASALSHVHYRPPWTAHKPDSLLEDEARSLIRKGFDLKTGAWVLLIATIFVGLTAMTTLR